MSFEAWGEPEEAPDNLPTICPDCEDGDHWNTCRTVEFEHDGWLIRCECDCYAADEAADRQIELNAHYAQSMR